MSLPHYYANAGTNVHMYVGIPEGDFLWLRGRGGLYVRRGSKYNELGYPHWLLDVTLRERAWGHVDESGVFWDTPQSLILE